MLKGLKALFTSRAILHPMTFWGIIFGFYSFFHFAGFEELYAFYKLPWVYLSFIFIAAMYNIIFKRTYVAGGKKMDYPLMFANTLFSSLHMTVASIVTVAFCLMFWMK